jgi:hypothetical protein
LLSVLALFLVLVRLDARRTVVWAAAVGSLAVLVVVTKLTAWVVVAAIAAWRHGRSAAALAFIGGAVAVSGWWFVRNVVLYGDRTAHTASRRPV